MMPFHIKLSAAAVFALTATLAWAKATPDEIAKLGHDMTPVGAEKAGNKDNTIPAWDGGLTKSPAGFDVKKGYVDPFAGEKPLFTITAANAEQYKDKLSVGQLAMLKKYPTFKMNVYPTHRTAAYPANVTDDVKKFAGSSDLAANANGVVVSSRLVKSNGGTLVLSGTLTGAGGSILLAGNNVTFGGATTGAVTNRTVIVSGSNDTLEQFAQLRNPGVPSVAVFTKNSARAAAARTTGKASS